MDRVWWERVPNAMAFIHDITESLLAEKSIMLQSEQGMPWYNTMASLIKETVMQQNSSKRFELIRHVDEPGRYLLQEFCKPEKRAAYRPIKTFAKFFAESDDIVLHTRYLWVYISSPEELKKWSEFVTDYIKERGKTKETAVFILEWQGERVNKSRKGIRIISFDDYINDYDRMVFSMLASSSVRESIEIKKYLGELASNITGNDIELAAVCVKNYREFLRDPFAVINDIIKNENRSNGAAFVYTCTKDELENCIWRSQIKTIYPLIEAYRGTFVKKYSVAISNKLPIASAYGEIYSDPKDVELGTLVYMVDNGEFKIATKEYNKLKLFKDARNKLSHLSVLSMGEIQMLLDK